MTSKHGAGGAGSVASMGEVIAQRLETLKDITDESGRLTRLYLSPAHRRAIDLVGDWMREARMEVALDATGSVIGRTAGPRADAPTLLIGSHIDTVRNAGAFDGNLGVVVGIEVVRRLAVEGRRLACAIEVVAFGDEEGVRFASTLGGSRALAGTFDARILDERDGEGQSRRDALVRFGCDPAGIQDLARPVPSTLGYLEVHIEQGPVLEAEALAVGVVTAINGASRGTIRVLGESAHGGTVPMRLRRDALGGAAEMILAIERIGAATEDLVATVGRIEVDGAATNTIPGAVTFSLDVRHPQDAARAAAIAAIRHEVLAIATRRRLEAQIAIGYEAPATPCDAALSQALAEGIAGLGHPVRRLASGAGHDAMAFRGVLPVAMLFVRCRGGISHNPAEHASVADIDVAARVLKAAVERIGG